MQRFDDRTLGRLERSVHATERLTPAQHHPFGPDRATGMFQIVRGKVGSAYTGTTGTFMLTHIVPLGEWSPYPGSEIVVVNVNKASGSAGTAYAIYHYAVRYPGTGTGTGSDGRSEGTGTGDGNWELFALTAGSGSGGPASLIPGCYFKEVGAASYSLSGTGTDISVNLNHGYTEDAVILMARSGTGWEEDRSGGPVDIVGGINFSKTAIRASFSQPVILLGYVELLDIESQESTGTGTGTGTESVITPTRVFIPANWDMRALPGFTTGTVQVAFHESGTGAFGLGGEHCTTGTGTGT